MLYYILVGCAITFPESFDSQTETSPQIEWVKYDIDCPEDRGAVDWSPDTEAPVFFMMVEAIPNEEGEIYIYAQDYAQGYRTDTAPISIPCSPDAISATITLGFWRGR